MKVLLVNDSAAVRQVQRQIMTQLGITQVMEANRCSDANDTLLNFNADLIVIDADTQRKSGMTFIRDYRATGGKASIILLTGDTNRRRLVEAIKSGVNSYLIKPFTVDALLQRVQDTVTRFAAVQA